ncbi:PAS domain S-box protein [Algoriphagus aquimarinus]|mgnify:CR=1 FL=1|uniref:PAS domain S-box protein n=1 Tax=Algoriphagus aquimarinus TaxID=237018 RepID=UPI0030DBD60E|tara:strand:- start:62166 stop:66443 length:4278 start_codon:yes stop_codon:yes gene_type:complete
MNRRNQFNQFDVSDVFNEIKDPLLVLDSEEIIFFNSFYLENFSPIADFWMEVFKDKELIKSLAVFFETGEVPQNTFIGEIQTKTETYQEFEWSFTNLPSSYTSRFLIIRGHEIKFQKDWDKKKLDFNTKGSFLEELEYVQSILSNSHDLIAILDEEGTYKFVSPSVGEKMGFPVEEIIGKNYKELVQSGILELVKGSFEDVFSSNEAMSIDFWVRLRNGKRVYLESFAKNLLQHPQINGVLFSSRDITDYIESQISLKRRYEIENLINQISGLLINSSSLKIETLFKDSLRLVAEFFQAAKSQVFIFNKDSQRFESLTGLEMNSNKTSIYTDVELLILLENCKEVLEVGEVLLELCDDVSVLLIPMISKSKMNGVIALGLDSFSQQHTELQIFRQLGDLLASAYEGNQLTKRIERNESLLTTTELLSKSGSWRFNNSLKIFFISEGLSNLFEFEGDLGAADFPTLLYKIEKSSRPDFLKNLKKVIKELSKASGEFVIKNRLGKFTYINYEIEARKDALTQGLEVFGFCNDITHRRATENYLKLQSKILAQVSDPILVTDLNLDVIFLNEAAILLCCPESTSGFSGQIGELFKLKLDDGLGLKEVSSALKVGEQWKKVAYLENSYTESTPFEISIQKFQAEQEDLIGYSFILRSLAEKYENERVAKRAQMIVENSSAVLFRVDPEKSYTIKYISENILQYGYKSTELKSISFVDFLHPDDAKNIRFHAENSKGATGIPSVSGEYRFRKSDGTYAWVEDRTYDVLNDKGDIIMHEGYLQDITDRKNLEIYNQEKDKLYRILAANIPGINIFLLDKDRNFILAEGTNFDHWEMSRFDFEGKNISEISLTDYAKLETLIHQVYIDREIVETEFTFKERFYHRIIRPIIENGEVKYALSVVRDKTEEQQTKENLLKSEEKYRTLVEESTEIIFSLSETFELSYISPNVQQFLGYAAEDVIGKSILNYLNPEDLDVFQSMLGETRDFLAENQYLEFRVKHLNGHYCVFSSNGKMVFDRDGGGRNYTGIARDITELKQTQKDLFHAKVRAEEASRVKSQFLSIMSHEIRTPMSAVIGLSHLLVEENPREDQLEILNTLQFSAENLMVLINDILDFNKMDSGKVELESISFDLRVLINRIIHSYSFQAKEKGIKISAEIDGEIPHTLIGDSVRISQIINNLLSNAIKFTNDGQIRLNLQLVSASNNECEIKFGLQDTGIGIPEDKLDLIFEAFTQASTDTTRKFGGTGLGLAIVKRLVELHGARIEVSSSLNVGTNFEFTLKFTSVEENNFGITQAIENKEKSLHDVSILVAEDNVVNQILIKKFLKKWHVGNLVIASDGQEAIDEYERAEFDIVLLDIQMPVLDGFSVAKMIRENSDFLKAQVPILVLSASSYQEIKAEMDEFKIDDFVEKPFSPEGLYQKVTEYLKPKDRS